MNSMKKADLKKDEHSRRCDLRIGDFKIKQAHQFTLQEMFFDGKYDTEI